ncbi:heme ABC exporter ATP-binding protein CcmA [Commensalibacter nepenthis]|uniref:Heme ABC exporter ATP-binding protein CcmA n=1 Tax=Commensalibacter nepenthis TaxID=3043872 RepID=A0ABT6Q7M7_9PROT|nr:heme ABC exporter ATP-binding protein CcmA [Commensalibacter sp. TBRC 10068]MDI2112879.1 heme ABC exporter ATP-binding protein CcmA [Commensalibacter sp. TBRC 10068]
MQTLPIISANIFKINHIRAFHGEKLILKNISFSLSSGESLIITGQNGAGKSTLLRILAGLKSVDAGIITWNDQDISKQFIEHTQNIAWLSHQDSLKPALTVKENLQLTSQIYNTNIQHALTIVNLNHMADIAVRMLSAGQKRRTALARILLKPAQLWLLDEPTVGLDQETIEQLGFIFKDFTKQGGMIITTTHIPLPLENSKTLHLTPSSSMVSSL